MRKLTLGAVWARRFSSTSSPRPAAATMRGNLSKGVKASYWRTRFVVFMFILSCDLEPTAGVTCPRALGLGQAVGVARTSVPFLELVQEHMPAFGQIFRCLHG